jgi:hypothetical protein
VFILPSPTSIAKAGDLKTIKPSLDIDLSNSPAPGAYPITITTWVLAVPGRPKNNEVRDVLGYFYGAKAQGQLVGMGFAPLPGKLKAAAIRAAAAL